MAYANRQLKILPEGIAPDQVRKQPIEKVAKLRDACYDRPEILERYLAAEPRPASRRMSWRSPPAGGSGSRAISTSCDI